MQYEIIEVTPVCDTLILASGDVVSDTAQISALKMQSGVCLLRSLCVVDEDDQGQALDILFFSANRTVGVKNAAPNISDADARDFRGLVQVVAADFIDLTGVRVACKSGLALVLPVAALYFGLICRSGTPTYTASGLKFRFGIEHST